MTLSISAWVVSSVTTTRERVSGSTWMVASPSMVLLRYWRRPVALELFPPELLLGVRLELVRALLLLVEVLRARDEELVCANTEPVNEHQARSGMRGMRWRNMDKVVMG